MAACDEVKNELSSCQDFTKCPICLDEFKSPKCLPCSHSFCCECLSTHIQSSCKSKMAPVGFRCPLCRNFIPSENISVTPSNWANDFPTNDKVSKIAKITGDKLCDACKREGEEVEANQYCLMCEDKLCAMCVKYHRRFNFTKDHKLFLLEELRKTPIMTEAVRSCLAHSEENIKYYCKYHSLPCCATCVCTTHKECNDIETISVIAEELRTKDFNNFCGEIGDLETELTVIKVKVEKNISNIEEKSVELCDRAEKLYTKILQHLEKQKAEYLNQLSTNSKECIQSLHENAESVCDNISYLEHCRTSLNRLKEEKEDVHYVRKIHETRKKITMLKDVYVRNKDTLNSVKLMPDLEEYNPENMKCFVSVGFRDEHNTSTPICVDRHGMEFSFT